MRNRSVCVATSRVTLPGTTRAPTFIPTSYRPRSPAIRCDSSVGVKKYWPVCLMPLAIKYPTEPRITTAPTANFIPAFMCLEYTPLADRGERWRRLHEDGMKAGSARGLPGGGPMQGGAHGTTPLRRPGAQRRGLGARREAPELSPF